MFWRTFLLTSHLAGLLAVSGAAESADLSSEDAVARIRSAVVGIVVRSTAGNASPEQPDYPTVPAATPTKGTIIGTGIVISPDGLVLTIASLIRNAERVEVVAGNGKHMQVAVVGSDRNSDLALLRVPSGTGGHASLAVPTEVALGERVLAVGRVVLDGESAAIATDGVISAIHAGTGGYQPAIQSTVTLPPGMGGAALVRQKTGEVIGIISSKFVPKDGGPTLAFAIPIESFLRVKPELLEKGFVSRGVIGISAKQISATGSAALGLKTAPSVVITAVRSGSPADAAGLRIGDIVLTVDGTAVDTVPGFFQAIAAKPVGTQLELRIFRRGEMLEIKATSEEMKRQ